MPPQDDGARIATGSGIGVAYPPIAERFLRLDPQLRVQSAPKGRLIVQEGDFADHSMLLLTGWAALSKTLPDGDTQIIDVMLPGDFALIGAVVAPVAACTVEALSDVQFLTLQPENANGADPQMADLRGLLAAMIVTTQARTAELLLRLGKSSAAGRIAYALLELYVRLEDLGLTRNTRFAFPMTQHKLGEFTGLSNVHVCRTLRRMERAGIVAYPDPHDIALTDLDALCEIAGIDLETFRSGILILRPR